MLIADLCPENKNWALYPKQNCILPPPINLRDIMEEEMEITKEPEDDGGKGW